MAAQIDRKVAIRGLFEAFPAYEHYSDLVVRLGAHGLEVGGVALAQTMVARTTIQPAAFTKPILEELAIVVPQSHWGQALHNLTAGTPAEISAFELDFAGNSLALTAFYGKHRSATQTLTASALSSRRIQYRGQAPDVSRAVTLEADALQRAAQVVGAVKPETVELRIGADGFACHSLPNRKRAFFRDTSLVAPTEAKTVISLPSLEEIAKYGSHGTSFKPHALELAIAPDGFLWIEYRFELGTTSYWLMPTVE